MALPVVEYLTGSPLMSFPDDFLYEALSFGTFQPASESRIVLATSDGVSIVFKGDFTVSNGVVTGGTVTNYFTFAGNGKVMKASGYEIAATELIDAVAEWQTFNVAPLNALLFDVATKYSGSEVRDQFGSTATGSKVLGRAGDDTLLSRGEDIFLSGGKGNDLLFAEVGLCTYRGGQGQDGFVFVDPMLGNRIEDFSPEDDVFLLDPFTFIGVGPGELFDDQFKIGKRASTPDEIIIYTRSKGTVWYDQDGSDTVYAPVKFAKIQKGLDLAADNFVGEFGAF